MDQLSRLVGVVLQVSLLMLYAPAALGELQNVSVNGATYHSVDEVNPHVGVLKGIVRDPAGKAVAGATLGLTEEPKLISDTGPEAGFRRERVYEVPKGRRLLQTVAQSTVDGTFVFSLLPLSSYTVMAFLPDGRYKGKLTLTVDNPEQTLDIALEPAWHIRGIVVDSQGNPLQGASVDATTEGEPIGWEGSPWAYPLSGMTTTAEDGSFEILAAPVTKYSFLVSRDGSLVGQFQRGITFDGTPLRFVALSAGRVHGTVVDGDTSHPLSNILLGLVSDMPNINGGRTVVTDDMGCFAIAGVYPGVWKVAVWQNPQSPHGWIQAEPLPEINVTENGDVEVAIRLVRGGTITGRVVCKEDGHGIGGARIGVKATTNDGNVSVPAVTTDSTGAYKVIGLPEGECRLWYESAEGFPQGGSTTGLLIGAKLRETVAAPDIIITKGLTVSGRVFDESLRPAAGVSVLCQIESLSRCQSALSGPDGSFQVYGLRAGDTVRVWATRSFGLDKTDELVSEAAGPFVVGSDGINGVIVTAFPPSTVSGVLVDAAGRPVADVWVNQRFTGSPAPPFSGPGGLTDSSGCFTVKHMTVGEYSLSIDEPNLKAEQPVRVGRGEALAGVKLVCSKR